MAVSCFAIDKKGETVQAYMKRSTLTQNRSTYAGIYIIGSNKQMLPLGSSQRMNSYRAILYDFSQGESTFGSHSDSPSRFSGHSKPIAEQHPILM